MNAYRVTPYTPQRGSIAARAVVQMRRGPVRLCALAEQIGEDRRSVYMCLRPAVKTGMVVVTLGIRDGERGRAPAIYELADWDDGDQGLPEVRWVEESSVQPTCEALRAANPFGGAPL